MAIVAPAAPSTPSRIAARSSASTPMPSAMPMSSVTTWRSANVLRANSTSRLSAACHAIISSMWSKNAMPLTRARAPAARRATTRTVTSASRVTRRTIARPSTSSTVMPR